MLRVIFILVMLASVAQAQNQVMKYRGHVYQVFQTLNPEEIVLKYEDQKYISLVGCQYSSEGSSGGHCWPLGPKGFYLKSKLVDATKNYSVTLKEAMAKDQVDAWAAGGAMAAGVGLTFLCAAAIVVCGPAVVVPAVMGVAGYVGFFGGPVVRMSESEVRLHLVQRVDKPPENWLPLINNTLWELKRYGLVEEEVLPPHLSTD